MTLSPTRIRQLARTYGLTPDQYAALTAGGRCPLCRRRYSPTRPAAIDHDHDTGLIRGAPCVPCNYRLGLFNDDIGWLERAARYLDIPPAPDIIGAVHVPGSPPTLV